MRGKAEGNISLSFLDELEAQVEKLEKEISKAEAAGKDSGAAPISARNGTAITATDAGSNAVSLNKDAVHIWVGDKR